MNTTNLVDFMNSEEPVELIELKLSDIHPDPEQDRKDWHDEANIEHINELAQSISERGLDDPIKVRKEDGKYIIFDGECRYRALKQLGKKTTACLYYKDIDKKQAYDAMLSTQVNKLTLKPLELSEALNKRINDGWTAEELSKTTGKSRAWISKRLTLKNLPEEVKDLARDGLVIDPENLKKIANLPENDRVSAVEKIKTGSPIKDALKTNNKGNKPSKEVKTSSIKVKSSDIKLIIQKLDPDYKLSDDSLLDDWDKFLRNLKNE